MNLELKSFLKFFGIVLAVLIAVLIVLLITDNFSQEAKAAAVSTTSKPKPPTLITPKLAPPLVPLTNVTQEADGSFSAWCGQDFINYRVEYGYGAGVETVWMNVQWFHNDPRAKVIRSFGYAPYDRDGILKVAAIVPLQGPGDGTAPLTFTEDPAGFWGIYVHRTGASFGATDPGVSPLVVMFFFRNKDGVCPLRKTFWFGGKG